VAIDGANVQRKIIGRPMVGAHMAIQIKEVPVKAQDHGQRMFRHINRIHATVVGNGNAQFAA
jgi:hypothetical protein